MWRHLDRWCYDGTMKTIVLIIGMLAALVSVGAYLLFSANATWLFN
jgi:hypothetical protein